MRLPDFNVNPLEDEESLFLVLWFLLLALFLALALLGIADLLFWILAVLPILSLLSRLSEIRMRFFTKWGRLHYPLISRFERIMDFDLFSLGVVRDALKDGSDYDYFDHLEIELRILLKSLFPELHGTELKPYVSTTLSKGKAMLRDRDSVIEIFLRKDRNLGDKNISDGVFNNVKKLLSAAKKDDDVWFDAGLYPRLVIADLVERKYGRDEKLEYLYAVLKGEAWPWFRLPGRFL